MIFFQNILNCKTERLNSITFILKWPMINKYSKNMRIQETTEKVTPTLAVINQILNYSKSLEVKKLKHKKVLYNLN